MTRAGNNLLNFLLTYLAPYTYLASLYKRTDSVGQTSYYMEPPLCLRKMPLASTNGSPKLKLTKKDRKH